MLAKKLVYVLVTAMIVILFSSPMFAPTLSAYAASQKGHNNHQSGLKDDGDRNNHSIDGCNEGKHLGATTHDNDKNNGKHNGEKEYEYEHEYECEHQYEYEYEYEHHHGHHN